MKRTGLNIICSLLLAGGMCACTATPKQTEEIKWSERMAQSEMQRFPEPWMIEKAKKPRWGYTHGLVVKSMLEEWKHTGDTAYYNYAKIYADSLIDTDGKIKTMKYLSFNIDNINAGKILFDFYEKTGDGRYKVAMDTLRKQLAEQPRTSEGGFWHKKVYPFQMWLDGLYMGEPYYAEYTATFDADNTQAYADIVNQFLLVAKRTYDKETGLYRHAWDEIKALPWSDKSGRAPHVWGRALGWYMMAIVDVLDYLPESQPGRDKMITILQNIVKNLAKYQDPKTGAWCQVIDQTGREGNYLEMSCTPMYAYAIAKGVRKGYLDPSALEMAKKAYQGILDNFIKVDEKGLVSLTNVCGVAGLGGKPYRDGSFDYYVNEIVRDNDPKGVAPFIMLCLEMNN